MEHPTALVVDDATTPFTCSCMKLRESGWAVICRACGRGVEAGGAQLPELVVQEAVWTEQLEVDAEDRLRHRRDRVRAAAGDGWVLEDTVDRYEEECWSSIEPDDVERDDRLVDEAERRVA